MMSDGKKQGLGLFINKKGPASSPSSPGPLGLPKEKDVKKRWLYVGVGVVGVVVLASTIFGGDKPEPRERKVKEAGTIAVNPPNADKAAFESRYARDLEIVKQDLIRLQQEKDAQARLIEQMREEGEREKRSGTSRGNSQLPAGIAAPPVFPGESNSGGLTPLAPPPEPPVPPRLPSAPEMPSGPAVLPGAVPVPGGTSIGAPLVFPAPGAEASGGGAPSEGTNAKVTYQRNQSRGMLPAGAFAKVALLNGLEAGTSSTTQTNPMPILMNVTENAILPGAARYQLKSCFVLGSGYGDLSSERVYARFSRLSCVDKNDKLVLSQEVAGYLVDSDGKLGMRGEVMNRQGAKLGQSTIAAFASGLANAFGRGSSGIMDSVADSSSALGISGSQTLRVAGLSGAQEAAAQLAQFYLKEAQSIFPVISVDAGRMGTIVFTGSASLNWGSAEGQFVETVTPQN